MNRVRYSIVACVLTLGGLGLEATHAQERGRSSIREGAAPKNTAPDTRSNFRKFIDAIKGKETSTPRNRDWTTGRDDGFSKPWVRR
jgi:hypothetical protein